MSICVCLCVYVCDGWMFHPSDLSAPFRSQTNQTKKNWAQHQELGKIIYHFNDHTFSSSGGTHSRSRIDILGNFVKFHIWTSSVWMFLEVNDQFCITIFPRTYVWGGGLPFSNYELCVLYKSSDRPKTNFCGVDGPVCVFNCRIICWSCLVIMAGALPFWADT